MTYQPVATHNARGRNSFYSLRNIIVNTSIKYYYNAQTVTADLPEEFSDCPFYLSKIPMNLCFFPRARCRLVLQKRGTKKTGIYVDGTTRHRNVIIDALPQTSE